MAIAARKIFGDGVDWAPKESPAVPLEIRKDAQGIAFTLYIRRVPRLESKKIRGVVETAGQLGAVLEPEQYLDGMMEAVKQLTRPRGKNGQKPAVIENVTGMTLENYERLVNDHHDLVGEIFDKMRADRALEFPHLVGPKQEPTILEYLLVQNDYVRDRVLRKMDELIEEAKEAEEGKGDASESSSA